MANQWLRGVVKAVPSGDAVEIMGKVAGGPPPMKVITLSSLICPRLARRDGKDEPWAWESREYLRKKLIGKEVTFKVDYTVPAIDREFGTIFLGNENVALSVVAEGWAKVRTQVGTGPQSPYIDELIRLEEQAQAQQLGIWNKTPGAAERAVRNLPPSAVGDGSSFDAQGLLETSKGQLVPAIVEMVRDGSTVRVWLMPSFQFVQVYLTGIQCPSMGRRPPADAPPPVTDAKPEGNGSADPTAAVLPPTAAQRLAASSVGVEVAPDPFGREAKHFTEVRVLHRDVRIVLEGVDKYNNLFGSLHYPKGEQPQDLAIELVREGLARVVEWSAAMMEPQGKEKLKVAERAAKQERLRIWTNFVAPVSASTAIRDDNFTGTVVEVVSGDCLVVADDAAPVGSPQAERRVNLSSIRAPKIGNPRRDEKPAPYAREAKEFLRSRLIGQKVTVAMEYSRKVAPADDPTADSNRVMAFGSVFLAHVPKDEQNGAAAAGKKPEAGVPPAPEGINVAEMLVGRGLASVVRHRDFEERSTHYDALLAAESRASKGKKGTYSTKEPPAAHVNDLSDRSAASKAKQFLPFLQRNKRQPAVVDYVLSGHRFKLLIPKESVTIAFSLSGVRCPSRDEPYSEEAIAFMRRKILQRDVEVEIEALDKTGTFLGSLYEGKTNVGVALLEAGLAKLHPFFNAERVSGAADLQRAEAVARDQRLKVWEGYVPGAEAVEEKPAQSNAKTEVLNVKVTEVIGGGKFYVNTLGDPRLGTIEQQLESLKLKDRPLVPGTFTPRKGELVVAQFSGDESWARAVVVNAPRDTPTHKDAQYEVFYVDYGNQETTTLGRLRPLDQSLSATAAQSQLFQLAHIKVPELGEDYGVEAAEFLSSSVGDKPMVARVENRDVSGGKAKSQGTGPKTIVTLVDPDSGTSMQAALLAAGLARLEKVGRNPPKQKGEAIAALQEHQEAARKARLCLWQYGDIDSDEEEAPRAWGRR